MSLIIHGLRENEDEISSKTKKEKQKNRIQKTRKKKMAKLLTFPQQLQGSKKRILQTFFITLR